MRPKRFLLSLLATFTLGALVVLGLGVWLNPWGDFGPNGFHRLPNARYTKTSHIDRLPASERAQVYVLGSSTVMRFSAETIERLSGQRAFNYGVFWGRSEDFYAIAQHLYEDLGERPELFIVGLDVWTLRPPERIGNPAFKGFERRLVNTLALSRHLDEYSVVRRAWASLTDGLSQHHLDEGFRARRGTTRAPFPSRLPTPELSIWGGREWYVNTYDWERERVGGNVYEAVEAGDYRITDAFRQHVLADPRREFDFFSQYVFDDFWPKRVAYLERFLAAAEAHGTKVAFVLTPVQPLFRRYLLENSPYAELLAKQKALLAELQEKHANVLTVLDVSVLADVGGDPEGFYDEIHPATRNCDLLLERLYAELGASERARGPGR